MDPHFLLPNWKRTFLEIFCVPQRGNDPPIYLLLWPEAGAAATCGGLRLLATHARSISLFWQMKEKKSFYSCSLFVIFIHSLDKDVCSRHPFVIEYGSQAQPCLWKLRPFGDQCQQFGDHCLCLKLWQFEIISVGMKAPQIRCQQSVPYPGPRMANFRTENKALTTLTLLAMMMGAGNSKWLW